MSTILSACVDHAIANMTPPGGLLNAVSPAASLHSQKVSVEGTTPRSANRGGLGFLDVLNCGSGHLSFRFNRNQQDEVDKAKKVIADMLKRGYMIFVLVDGKQTRVRSFDAAHDEYILEEPDVIPEPEPVVRIKSEGKPSGRRPGRRAGIRDAKATAIGPSAGG